MTCWTDLKQSQLVLGILVNGGLIRVVASAWSCSWCGHSAFYHLSSSLHCIQTTWFCRPFIPLALLDTWLSYCLNCESLQCTFEHRFCSWCLMPISKWSQSYGESCFKLLILIQFSNIGCWKQGLMGWTKQFADFLGELCWWKIRSHNTGLTQALSSSSVISNLNVPLSSSHKTSNLRIF